MEALRSKKLRDLRGKHWCWRNCCCRIQNRLFFGRSVPNEFCYG